MGHDGMRYSLQSRELIADSVETMVKAHCFDGLVCIPNCDKIIEAGNANGGSASRSTHDFRFWRSDESCRMYGGKALDLISVFEGIGAYQEGKISESGFYEIECCACPGWEVVRDFFTANSMNCLCEALGIALPGNGTILSR